MDARASRLMGCYHLDDRDAGIGDCHDDNDDIDDDDDAGLLMLVGGNAGLGPYSCACTHPAYPMTFFLSFHLDDGDAGLGDHRNLGVLQLFVPPQVVADLAQPHCHLAPLPHVVACAP